MTDGNIDHDFAGHIVSIVAKDGAGALVDDFESAFDAAGQLTSQTDNGQTKSFAYDLIGQLTGDGSHAYGYDANGNRNTTGDVVGAGNRLLSDGTYDYGYDNEGNVVSKVDIATGAAWQFDYDAKNELVRATHTAGGAVDKQVGFGYDVFGNRIEQDVWSGGAEAITKFALDGWKDFNGTPVGNENWDVWADLNADNTLQSRYLRGDVVDQLFAQIGADKTASWYLTDRLGSVRTVLDGSGAVLDRVSYDGFGNVVVETAPQYRGRYGWTGRETEVTTGLQYNRARYYDSQTGRWMSQDPLGFAAGDSNLSRYVGNKATAYTDPSGLAGVGTAAPVAPVGTGIITRVVGPFTVIAAALVPPFVTLTTAVFAPAVTAAQAIVTLAATAVAPTRAIAWQIAVTAYDVPTQLLWGLGETLSPFPAQLWSPKLPPPMTPLGWVSRNLGRLGGTAIGLILLTGGGGVGGGGVVLAIPTGGATLVIAIPALIVFAYGGVVVNNGLVLILTKPVPFPAAFAITTPAPGGVPAQPTPSLPHPGNIPAAQAPGPGFEWRGQGPAGGRQGNWFNPATGESLSNDMNNAFHGPHWDYRIQGVRGKWRWYPDGKLEYSP